MAEIPSARGPWANRARASYQGSDAQRVGENVRAPAKLRVTRVVAEWNAHRCCLLCSKSLRTPANAPRSDTEVAMLGCSDRCCFTFSPVAPSQRTTACRPQLRYSFALLTSAPILVVPRPADAESSRSRIRRTPGSLRAWQAYVARLTSEFARARASRERPRDPHDAEC